MKKRPLGNTGISVSEIAFGGVEIGMPYGIGVRSEADMLAETEAVQLLHAAVEAGINFFDTARMYGNSEAIMGKAFKDRRSDLIIATKCRHFRRPDGSLPETALLKTFIESSLEESLAALQTDYIDVFMLHQADLGILENDAIAGVFSDLKAQGVIRATGASTYTVEETLKAIDSRAWDVIQLPFNLMDQRQATLFPLAARQGVGLVIRSVLLKGLLTGKGRGLHPALAAVEDHLRRYDELLDETAPDPATLATRFALSFEAISAILVGIDRLDYLHQSLAAADGTSLKKSTLKRAGELAYPDPEFLNLPYWDKMGWLK